MQAQALPPQAAIFAAEVVDNGGVVLAKCSAKSGIFVLSATKLEARSS